MRLASRSATLAVGVGVLLALVLALYLSLTASTGLPGQSFRTLSADFDDVGNLRVGDDVRRASVRVGQVRSITFEDDHADVVMQLADDARVYRDAHATIVARSALGQNFVQLDPGSPKAGEMPDDEEQSITSTESPVNLDQVLSALDPPTRRALASTLRETGSGAAGHSKDLADALAAAPELLRDLGTVSDTLASPTADLAQTLRSAERLGARFEGRADRIASLADRLTTTLEAVAVDDGTPLGEALERAPATLGRTRTAMEALRVPVQQLDAAMTRLAPGAGALGRATADLRGTLREALVPLDKVPGVASAAEPAVRDLSGLMVDARPLADRLRKTFDASATPTAVLAPYSAEIARFFTYWASANQYRDASGHYLRIGVLVRPESFIGTTGLRDPLIHRNPYPAPGVAEHERARTLLGGR